VTCFDDATVLGLVEGRLVGARLAEADAHLDACASCRELVAQVLRDQGVLAAGHVVGRYVIGEPLGVGAMGRVYAAWQPELDRRVAIKLLHDGGARDRILREAQAMAKLSHPHVVTVHEVGSAPEGVYVAMELVDGEPLRAWAREARPWRLLVRVLADVARGLAAVHTAGVVHRDVKPDNVIVGRDGRARVGDFGLARTGGGGANRPDGGVLATGTALAGTPAYMAPEVLGGGAATAASDQFSFGTMAYEVLSGERPFGGATTEELARAIEAGEPRRLRGVPGWLDAIVRGCLAADPARRFTSLDAVADRLGAGTRRARQLAWLGGAAAVALVASGATWLVARDATASSCELGVAELAPVWNASARARWPTSADDAIDGWARRWRTERDATCVAARTDPSPRARARESCLDQQRAELAALIARGAASPERALEGASALPWPEECRGADVGQPDPLPLDGMRASQARAVAAVLPGVRAAIALGDARPVLATAAELVARARTADHAPTLAEALLMQAQALRGAGRLPDAAAAAREAAAAGERGHADLVAAQAWTERVAIAGEQRDLDRVEDLATLADAAIARAGEGAVQLAAQLARARGLVAYNRGQLARARELLSDARARTVAAEGERSLDVAALDSALGSVARAAGDLDEAERRHRAALATDRALRGDRHPDIARDLHNIAGVLRLRGDLDRALATYRQALALEIALQGETSAAAGLTHNSIGLVLMERRDWSGARSELEAAARVLEAAGHGDLALAEHNLGLVAQALGDHRSALAHFARAERVYAATIGQDATVAARLTEDRVRSERALAHPAATSRLAEDGAPSVRAPKHPAAAPRDGDRAGAGVYGASQPWPK
jgi:tetratricopeptide (TPR) repeat protein